jgi:hypothetical protein
MKKWLALLIASGSLLIAYTGCDSGNPRCAVCEQSFTDSDCQRIALEEGCTGGMAVVDPMLCGGEVSACEFTGCGDGPVTCGLEFPDAGP